MSIFSTYHKCSCIPVRVYLSYFTDQRSNNYFLFPCQYKKEISTKNNDDKACWHTPIILTTWEVEVGRIAVPGQCSKKVCDIPSQPLKAERNGACCHPGYPGTVNRRITFQVCLGINARLCPQNNKIKKGLREWLKW
jgi:hypothetical protein